MLEEPAEGVVTAMSLASEAEAVAQDLARQLIHPHLGFVLFFCSAEYDLEALGQALEQYFGGVRLVGCTSAGEITPLGYGRNCVSAVGFDHRNFSIASALATLTASVVVPTPPLAPMNAYTWLLASGGACCPTTRWIPTRSSTPAPSASSSC